MNNSHPSGAEQARRARHDLNGPLITVLALSAVAVILSVLVLIVVTQLSSSVASQKEQNEDSAVRERRTECVRKINDEVNDQRWTAVAHIFENNGDRAKEEEQVQTLLRTADDYVQRRVSEECPPPTDNVPSNEKSGGR